MAIQSNYSCHLFLEWKGNKGLRITVYNSFDLISTDAKFIVLRLITEKSPFSSSPLSPENHCHYPHKCYSPKTGVPGLSYTFDENTVAGFIQICVAGFF